MGQSNLKLTGRAFGRPGKIPRSKLDLSIRPYCDIRTMLIKICCKQLTLTVTCPCTSITCTTQRKKATIHQQTTMLSTSKNVPFPGHNHLLTTGADDPSLTVLDTEYPNQDQVTTECH